MPGRNRNDEPWSIDMAENMGRSTRKAPGPEASHGRVSAQDRSDTASDVGRRLNIPV